MNTSTQLGTNKRDQGFEKTRYERRGGRENETQCSFLAPSLLGEASMCVLCTRLSKTDGWLRSDVCLSEAVRALLLVSNCPRHENSLFSCVFGESGGPSISTGLIIHRFPPGRCCSVDLPFLPDNGFRYKHRFVGKPKVKGMNPTKTRIPESSIQQALNLFSFIASIIQKLHSGFSTGLAFACTKRGFM